MNTRFRLNQIDKLKQANIFFDANIWLYIFCPLGNYKKHSIHEYSNFYKTLLEKRNKIFTDIIVLSEVINRWCRLGFDQYKKLQNKPELDYKKDYRKTKDFKELNETILDALSQALDFFEVCNKDYKSEDLTELIGNINSNSDFNDQHIISLCIENRFYLLTNDGDFKNAKIPIISNNNIFGVK